MGFPETDIDQETQTASCMPKVAFKNETNVANLDAVVLRGICCPPVAASDDFQGVRDDARVYYRCQPVCVDSGLKLILVTIRDN